MRGLLPVRGGVPGRLHLHRGGGKHRKRLRISGGERYAKVYNIDYNRCIFCGYCVEACPTDAITHGHGFEIASYNTVNADLSQGADAGADSSRRKISAEAGRGTTPQRPRRALRRRQATNTDGLPHSEPIRQTRADTAPAHSPWRPAPSRHETPSRDSEASRAPAARCRPAGCARLTRPARHR